MLNFIFGHEVMGAMRIWYRVSKLVFDIYFFYKMQILFVSNDKYLVVC